MIIFKLILLGIQTFLTDRAILQLKHPREYSFCLPRSVTDLLYEQRNLWIFFCILSPCQENPPGNSSCPSLLEPGTLHYRTVLNTYKGVVVTKSYPQLFKVVSVLAVLSSSALILSSPGSKGRTRQNTRILPTKLYANITI